MFVFLQNEMKYLRRNMNRFFSIITLCVLTLCAMTSCLKDDNNYSNSPECHITSFTIADLRSPIKAYLADGRDTTYTVTLTGSNVLFNIDQLNNRIYSVDSLPSWTKIDAVLPTIYAMGNVYVRQGDSEVFMPFTNATDSIDFTKEVEFLVVANSGTASKTYQAVINKAKNDQDSLYWTTATTTAPISGQHRTVVRGDHVYVFANNNDTPTVVSAPIEDNAATWTMPENLSTSINTVSVTVFNNQFYALNDEGLLHRSNDGMAWDVVGTNTLVRLLCADNDYLYASDGTQIVGSTDGTTWTPCSSNADIDMLPSNPVSAATYSMRTNQALDNVVMMGLSAQNTEHAVVWYKVTSADANDNQQWNYIAITSDNSFGMPRCDNVQMVRYNNYLLAFGEPYDGFYRSYDNGIAWHKMDSRFAFPTDMDKDSHLCRTAVSVDGKIWLLQGDGKVWTGKTAR